MIKKCSRAHEASIRQKLNQSKFEDVETALKIAAEAPSHASQKETGIEKFTQEQD